MATEFYCDRCGGHIPRTDKWFMRHEERYHSVNLFHDEAKAEDPARWMLCKNCGDEFIHWFMQKKERK